MATPYQLDELNRESTYGGIGEDADEREIPVIDFSRYATDKAQIADALWEASTQVGFFQITGHGISRQAIIQAFSCAEQFFALDEKIKARYPRPKGANVGWESLSQIRPSTGTPDQKESYQITRPAMQGLWPTEQELAGFQSIMLGFEQQCWQVGMQVLSCFADKLGFSSDFFSIAHQPDSTHYQSTLRLLHYYPTEPVETQGNLWRAGAHTDFDCLTLLFQHEGHGGLQVCPGKEAQQGRWTNVPPRSDVITCNIGDMLQRWSDDALQSNLHRVRMPRVGEYTGSRQSIAFFCQANKDMIIEGPARKYPPISAADFLNQRIQANFTKADGGY